jgi:hypothetical protein
MNKLAELYYWLRIFLSPFILLNALGIYIYWSNEKLWWLSILIGLLGCVLGLYFAERIRKRLGTSQFMSEIHHTDDVKTYEEIVQSDRTNN